jgi:hypothetical protein
MRLPGNGHSCPSSAQQQYGSGESGACVARSCRDGVQHVVLGRERDVMWGHNSWKLASLTAKDNVLSYGNH